MVYSKAFRFIYGWNEYVTCSRCEYTTYEELPPAGHGYSKTVFDPTCTAEGYTEYVCAVCGDSYVGDIVPTVGHKYENEVCIMCGEKEPDYILGDFNGDGQLNAKDMNMMKRILVGQISPTDKQKRTADIDGDGKVTSKDTNLLQKIIAGTY